MQIIDRSWALSEQLAPLLTWAIEANSIARDLWKCCPSDGVCERIGRLEADLESFGWDAENLGTTTSLALSKSVVLTIALREAPAFLRMFAKLD
jgi:hypothetical protein